MPFDDLSEQEHEFPAGPTNNYDTYYPDGYEDDEFDWRDEDDYEFREEDYDGYDNDDYLEPTRLEYFRWQVGQLWWKVKHPIFTARRLWRERIFYRWFTKCAICGRRGTRDGELCGEEIPF